MKEDIKEDEADGTDWQTLHRELNVEVVRLRERVADLEIERKKSQSRLEEQNGNTVGELAAEIVHLKEELSGSREVVELKRLLMNREAEVVSLTQQLNAQLVRLGKSGEQYGLQQPDVVERHADHVRRLLLCMQ